MLNQETERLAQVTDSCEYRAFGFGTDSFEFASRLLALRDTDSKVSNVLFDISDRVLFVDYLRFETGWQLDEEPRSVSDSMRFSKNLDALETYLLCTCIDALASRISEKGTLTENFADFFHHLPEYMVDFIVDHIAIIKGDHWRKGWEKWQALNNREKIDKLAKDYWYKVRRSKYTHRSNTQETAHGSHWLRMAERGLVDVDGHRSGWQITTLTSADNPEKVRYTLLTHATVEESYLLRAILTVVVLTQLFGYSLSQDYPYQFLEYSSAKSTLYAFLFEMQRNRACLDRLTVSGVTDHEAFYQSSPVPGLSTAAGERLLGKFPEYIRGLEVDIQGYLNQIRNLNQQINRFNEENDPSTVEWLERRKVLALFYQDFSLLSEVDTVRLQHWWIFPNLRRRVETGGMLRSSNKHLVD